LIQSKEEEVWEAEMWRWWSRKIKNKQKKEDGRCCAERWQDRDYQVFTTGLWAEQMYLYKKKITYVFEVLFFLPRTVGLPGTMGQRHSLRVNKTRKQGGLAVGPTQ
jgi:hypothetical protein